MLATSQEAFGVPGETVLRVASLAPPDGVQLFVDRASAKRPDFALTPPPSEAVDAICRRLDGIPLAIELAAARVNVLSPAQIAERLDDQFRLLTGGSRTALPRQQTLRATVDWSHQLLGEEEQVLLRRLSVFTGGCTLEAAEAVAGEKGESEWVLDALDRLVARSLVVAEEQDGAARYRLLGDDPPVRPREAGRRRRGGRPPRPPPRPVPSAGAAGRARAHRSRPGRLVAGPGRRVRQPARRHGVVRGRRGGRATVLEMATALWRFWLVRGHWAEGRSWLARACRPRRPRSRDRRCGRARWPRPATWPPSRPTTRWQALLDASLELWRELGEPEGMAKALNHLGNLARSRFEYDAARALLTEALDIRRAIGNQRGMAVSLRNLGLLAALQRDYDTARARYKEALPLARRAGRQSE